MTLGSEQGVTDICGSTDSNLISRQLVIARSRLTAMLTKEGASVPATDTLLSQAVDLLASSYIAGKPGAVDPRTNFDVDGFSRKEKLTSQPEDYADQAEAIIDDYVAVNTSDSPLPGISIVGREGVRIGEFTEMTEDQEDVY